MDRTDLDLVISELTNYYATVSRILLTGTALSITLNKIRWCWQVPLSLPQSFRLARHVFSSIGHVIRGYSSAVRMSDRHLIAPVIRIWSSSMLQRQHSQQHLSTESDHLQIGAITAVTNLDALESPWQQTTRHGGRGTPVVTHPTGNQMPRRR